MVKEQAKKSRGGEGEGGYQNTSTQREIAERTQKRKYTAYYTENSRGGERERDTERLSSMERISQPAQTHASHIHPHTSELWLPVHLRQRTAAAGPSCGLVRGSTAPTNVRGEGARDRPPGEPGGFTQSPRT